MSDNPSPIFSFGACIGGYGWGQFFVTIGVYQFRVYARWFWKPEIGRWIY